MWYDRSARLQLLRQLRSGSSRDRSCRRAGCRVGGRQCPAHVADDTGPGRRPTALRPAEGRQRRLSPRRRRLWPLLLAVVTGGAMVAAATFVLTREDEPGRDTVAGEEPSTSAPSAAGSPSVSTASPTPTALASVSPTGDYQCWDGTRTSSLRGCSNPTSAAGGATPLAGLNWIFVDRESRLNAVAPSCRDITGSKNRLLHRSCVFAFEGQTACVNWSQWTSPAAALEDYNHLGAPRPKDPRRRQRRPRLGAEHHGHPLRRPRLQDGNHGAGQDLGGDGVCRRRRGGLTGTGRASVSSG